MSRDAVTPPLFEKKARLLFGQWLDLMDKSNARIQLWHALQALVQPRHAQQHEPDLPAVRDIADLLQCHVFQPVRLIHNGGRVVMDPKTTIRNCSDFWSRLSEPP